MTQLTQHPPTPDEQEYDVRRTRLVSIGGGLGSFALLDRLRIGGASVDDLVVVSPHRTPDQAFAQACRNSGMGPRDRLRSDSSARIDSPWGFPGYAATEARSRKHPGPLLRSLAEPVLCQPYTPTVGLLRQTLATEAARIGWDDMLVRGEALRVFRHPDGGYVVIVRRRGKEGAKDLAIECEFVHLALGPAGPLLSPEAEEFRASARDGGRRLAHAYEPHEEVYRQLATRGGSVLVRGSGIASSRILQRIIDDKERSGRDVHIWQLFRSYHAEPTGPRRARRDAGCGFAYQAFNFPKAAFGGQLRDTTRRLSEEDRLTLVRELGATSTPYRTEWATQLRQGRAEGWYDAVAGEVTRFHDHGELVGAEIRLASGDRLRLDVDLVVDATGMDQVATEHPLVHDLVEQRLAEVNALGCLRVDERFVVAGSEEHPGAMFASGMTSRGAPLAPVDSFLGLQSAALSIAEVLVGQGLGSRLGPLRSVAQWWKWMGGRSL